MYVCVCNAVTERHIVHAVAAGARRLKDLRALLRVTDGCGRCAPCARQCLNQNLTCPRTSGAKPSHTRPTLELT